MLYQSISSRDYELFRKFLAEQCGITLGEDKQYLVVSRLSRLLKDADAGSVVELIDLAKKKGNDILRQTIINAMTTGETFWFRDTYPYVMLRELLFPELLKDKNSDVRIWSAASSSGQEAYSISMVAQEYCDDHPEVQADQVQIIGTDISPAMLQLARSGEYEALALSRGLSPERKKRFFHQGDDVWQLRDEIRKRVSFSELNLMNSYAALGKFQIVFCRNVLLYFSSPAKRDILRRIAEVLQPGGYLFLGSTETITRYSDRYEPIRQSGGVVYRLKPGIAMPQEPVFPDVTSQRR